MDKDHPISVLLSDVTLGDLVQQFGPDARFEDVLVQKLRFARRQYMQSVCQAISEQYPKPDGGCRQCGGDGICRDDKGLVMLVLCGECDKHGR